MLLAVIAFALWCRSRAKRPEAPPCLALGWVVLAITLVPLILIVRRATKVAG